ncbi:MAG: hypothetical protein AAGI23_06690 [Bacteroidota bacterium]
MNIKGIKLALTVQMLNKEQRQNHVLQAITDTMKTFREDVGNFMGFTVLKDTGISSDMINRRYAVRYENCTLNIDLAMNKATRSEYLNGFTLS